MKLINFPQLNSSHLIGCVILCAACFITYRFFDIAIYGSIHIYLGTVFSLFALLVLPLRYSIVVLLCSLASFYTMNQNSPFLVILISEFFVVRYIMQKANNFLIGISVYWVIIGFPLSSFLLFGAFAENLPTAIFTAVTISLNGFICGVFAMIAYWFVPTKSDFKQFVPPPPKFATVVFELCMVSVILPIVLATLVFTWRSTHETEIIIAKELEASAMQIKNSTDSLLGHNIETLQSATNMSIDWQLNELNLDSNQQTLNTIAKTNRHIESMFVANKDGDLLVVAPPRYAQIFAEAGNINVAQRDYFLQAKESESPVVSGVIDGRGLGNLRLVAIASPIIQQNTFNGIGQVAIALEKLVDKNVINTVEQKSTPVIITDSSGNIIYSSDELRLSADTKFSIQRAFHPFLRFTPALQIFENAYIYAKKENNYGWQIYTLGPPNKVFESIVTYFIYIAFTLFVSAIIIGLMANKLSTKITRPIVNLEDYIAKKVDQAQLEEESKISREIANVTSNFVAAHQLSINFQRNLEKQVDDKTKELNLANEQLLKLSRTDALTGIYNRGAFDELGQAAYNSSMRGNSPLSLVLFDIDYFKKVNDTHGHQAGDTVIKEVALILTQFCNRSSDIVARFGGEEFAILMNNSDANKHIQYLQEILTHVQNTTIMHGKVDINVTISGGVVSIKKLFNQSFEKVISLADEQLYLSKKTGRNKLSVIEL